MKNFMKKISILTLVAIITSFELNTTESLMCCGSSEPNPFIEIASIIYYPEILQNNIC